MTPRAKRRLCLHRWRALPDQPLGSSDRVYCKRCTAWGIVWCAFIDSGVTRQRRPPLDDLREVARAWPA